MATEILFHYFCKGRVPEQVKLAVDMFKDRLHSGCIFSFPKILIAAKDKGCKTDASIPDEAMIGAIESIMETPGDRRFTLNSVSQEPASCEMFITRVCRALALTKLLMPGGAARVALRATSCYNFEYVSE